MAKQYYLSNSGTHIGPFSYEAVLKKVEAGEYQWTDYVYDEGVAEWLLLMEHPEFSVRFSGKGLADTPTSSPLDNRLLEKEWFVMKNGTNHGPFCRLEIVQMLQEKSLFEYDFVWKSRMTTWLPLAEVVEFSAEEIRSLAGSGDRKVNEVFFRRRHARSSYGASLIVHNSKLVFKGEAFEISAGGAGILVQNSELQPGQSLFLHFQPGDGVPPFNAVCQVVSKQFVKDDSRQEPLNVKYGVKFTTLSQSIRESIKNYTARAA